jgi:hypothetical protein
MNEKVPAANAIRLSLITRRISFNFVVKNSSAKYSFSSLLRAERKFKNIKNKNGCRVM